MKGSQSHAQHDSDELQDVDVDIFEDEFGPQTQSRSQTVTESGNKRKKPKLRSKYWEDYIIVDIEVEDPPGIKRKGQCKRCGILIAADSSTNGTTALKRHTTTCKRREAGNTSQNVHSFQPGAGRWKFDQKDSRLALCEMIVIDELPFKFVEREGFRKFISRVCPDFKVPSRQTIREDCVKLFLEKRESLKSYFRKKGMGRVSITTDCWTAINNTNFICVTAHFIDKDWILHKKTIAFRKIVSHKGEDIGDSVVDVLNQWGLKNIMCCTMDNASANDGAIRRISRFLDGNTNVLNRKYLHVRCVAHITNLVVSDGLDEIGLSVRRVREAVKWIRASPKRIEEFMRLTRTFCGGSEKLLTLDVPTRWNSTYLMLESAELFEDAFKVFATVTPSYVLELNQKKYKDMPLDVPQADDWINVRKLMEYLKTFYDFTLLVSGTTYATAHLFFKEMCDIFEIISILDMSEDVEISGMAKKMKNKLGKYWLENDDLNPKFNKILYVAAVLDPRQKMNHVEMCLKKVYGDSRGTELVMLVRHEMNDLFELYKKQLAPTVSPRPPSSTSQSQATSPAVHRHRSRPRRVRGSCSKMPRPIVVNQGTEELSELVIYLSEKQHIEEDMGARNEEDDDDDDVIDTFDILNRWLKNGMRYPVLSEMARDILVIPISTVASESAFSMGGRVLDQFRSSLNPNMVEALICSSSWLKSSPIFMNDEEDSSEEEQDRAFESVVTSLGFVGETSGVMASSPVTSNVVGTSGSGATASTY